jgi:5-methylcytosine-specific restriction endonuclease McrA
MYKCKICEKEFETKQQLGGHCSSHNRGESYKEKRRKKSAKHYIRKKNSKLEIHICQYCGKKFKTGVALGGHTVYCKENPNKKKHNKKT